MQTQRNGDSRRGRPWRLLRVSRFAEKRSGASGVPTNRTASSPWLFPQQAASAAFCADPHPAITKARSSRNCAILLSCAAISDLLGKMIGVANEESHAIPADTVFLTVAVTGVIFLVEIGILIVTGMI
jgi:hypothetical protein